MNKDDADKPKEVSADVIDTITTVILEFREEMEESDVIGSRIAVKTRFIMRVVFTTLALSSLYLVFMIFNMASNMSAMTTHLEDMYGNFGIMSQNMQEITKSVAKMSDDISGMPLIAESMAHIDSDVRVMNSSVFEMNKSITAIDNDMVRINLNMYEMTGRLSNMNRTVYSISNDVNQMAAPVNSGPMSGMWPR